MRGVEAGGRLLSDIAQNDLVA